MHKIIERNHRIKLLLTPFILLGIVFASMFLTLVFQFRTIEDISKIPFERMLFGVAESLIVVFAYNYAVRKLNKVYPWKRNWFVRSLIDFGLAIISPFIIIGIITYSIKVGWIPDEDHHKQFKIIIYIMPLMISALLLVVVEMIVATEERNNLEVRLTEIEKEQISSKYIALKEQLDHHFLFNNLSVLSSLIYESTEKADKFIQDFASIYRYVLSINKQDLVSIKEELDFIDTYLNLYKFRFEEGFNYKLQVTECAFQNLIPPLTLQVVVENVFKHNVVSRQKPLELSISAENNSLIIKNNLQSKTDKVDSTRTGQSNLIEKFKLLNCELPEFYIKDGFYISRIPLIQPAHD